MNGDLLATALFEYLKTIRKLTGYQADGESLIMAGLQLYSDLHHAGLKSDTLAVYLLQKQGEELR